MALITTFYEAFAERDYASMQACYHENVVFSDPVFGDLEGGRARAMWHMLCEGGSDLEITFGNIETSPDGATAKWEAKYTLGGSDRRIHNVINATFEFEDGRINRHRDEFDLWKWTRMALGAPGVLLGWSGIVQGKVLDRAARQLDRFIAEHPEYQ